MEYKKTVWLEIGPDVGTGKNSSIYAFYKSVFLDKV